MNRLLISQLAVLMLSCSALAADSKQQRKRELESRIKPLLQKHCLDCHSGSEPDAGLTLDHFDEPIDFLKGRTIWMKAVQKMRIDEMPPPDVSELSDSDREELMAWIKSTIDDFECGLTPNPGQVTLRRLNAIEYKNTIRDLLDVNYSPAESFPGDDIGYGFDNIGDVLSLPPLLMEKYFVAAEQISRYVIKSPPPDKVFESLYNGDVLDGSGSAQNGNRVLASEGVASFREQAPWSGAYQLVISASGDQAGDEPCIMSIAVDEKLIARVPVRNGREEPQEYKVGLRLKAGSREIGIGFVNDFYQEAAGGVPAQDRNLVIHHVSLTSSQPSTKRLDPSQLTGLHRRLLASQQKNRNDDAKTARDFLGMIASRAFRRPIDPEQLDELTQLASNVWEDGGSFEEGIQVGLQAVLVSPRFLFRVEPPRDDPARSPVRDLDEFELATRLSYFLWSSMPDDELLKLAFKNQLREGDNLEKQIERMIQHKNANAFVENFAGQWLNLRKLRNFNPDPKLFPRWTPRIAELAERETLSFVAEIMRRDMSVLRLLDANFTNLNEELASYYGIAGVSGDNFRPVSLKGTARAGLLTQASVLAVTSNPTRTSPVKRGKWILENLLAQPPPPAPPGVPELKEKGQLIGSLRQRLEQHRADPACASCHKLMDPLGFALENFDAVGQFRTQDDGIPIDASGDLPDGQKVTGAAELRKTLVDNHQDEFVDCLTSKMLTYALGRGLEYYDKCAVDKIVENLRRDKYRFSRLIIEIVRSDPFQKKGARELE